MGGRSSQRKGRAGELELCRTLQAYGIPAEPGQARRDAGRFGDGLPAVFHRRNREGWRVTMELPDWLTLYRSYQPPRDSNHSGEE